MALTIHQQLLATIDRSHRIVIAVAKLFSVDALASALALARTLRKKEKDVRIVCEGWNEHAARGLGFLPDSSAIVSKLERLYRYCAQIDVAKTPIEEVSYEMVDAKLNIYLQPLHGTLSSPDIVLKDQSIPIDLIITVGAADLDALGTMNTDYADLFYSTPILNIDHAVENEHYGQWQLIDVASPSIAEVVYRMHDVLGIELIDSEGATLLLAGIIASTRSFSLPSVTPQTLSTASRLMSMGGRREEIVKSLYWKRSVGSLKLFGKLLGRLRHDASRKLAIAAMTTEDFLETQTEIHEIEDVAEEVFHTSPDLDLFVTLFPREPSGWKGLALSRRTHLLELLKPYKPAGGAHRASIELATIGATDAQKELLDHLVAKIPMTNV